MSVQYGEGNTKFPNNLPQLARRASSPQLSSRRGRFAGASPTVCTNQGLNFRRGYTRVNGTKVSPTCVHPRGTSPHAGSPRRGGVPNASPEKCGQMDKAFRKGYNRANGTYVSPTCTKYPQNNPWVMAIREMLELNPGMTVRQASHLLSPRWQQFKQAM